jgi:LytR cell envelope-related transcriptional attenuator
MTTPSPSGGPSPLRVSGLALVGAAVIAAIIGLATLATNGGPDTTPTAAPSALPTSTGAPAPAPEAAPPSPLPTFDSTVPVPPFPEPTGEGTGAPGAPAPGGSPAPGTPGAPGAPAPAPGGAPAPAPGGAPAPPPAAAPAPGGNGGGNGGSGDGGGGTGRVTSQGGGTVVRAPLRVYNNSRIQGLAARAAEDFRRAGWEVTDIGPYGGGIIPVTTVYYRPGTDEEAPARALAAQFGLRVEPRFEGIKDASPGIIVIVTREYGTQ